MQSNRVVDPCSMTHPEFPQEVLMFIRFDSNLAQAYKNEICSQLSMMQRIYHGRECFFSPEIKCIYGSDHRKRGLGILQFESIKNAHDWLISEPHVKQVDWLHGVDILIAPARIPWHIDMKDVEIIDWCAVHDPVCFQKEYLEVLPEPDPKNHTPYNVVAAPYYAMQRARGQWEPKYLVVYQKQLNEEDFHACPHHLINDMCIYAEIASGVKYIAKGC